MTGREIFKYIQLASINFAKLIRLNRFNCHKYFDTEDEVMLCSRTQWSINNERMHTCIKCMSEFNPFLEERERSES